MILRSHRRGDRLSAITLPWRMPLTATAVRLRAARQRRGGQGRAGARQDLGRQPWPPADFESV